MPRVTMVKKARKPQGRCGKCGDELPAGSPYRWWKFRYGGKRRRCLKPGCSPRQSDLTNSDKMSRLYAAQEAVEDAVETWDGGENVDDLKEALESAANEVREVGEEYRESKENMPDGLQEGEVGQNLEEAADACEEWADNLENAASEIEDSESTECEECDGEGTKECEKCDGNGTVTVDCEPCGGDGNFPCTVCSGGTDVPDGEDYGEDDTDCEPEGGEPGELSEGDAHVWDGDTCTRCGETREPDGYCNACRADDGDETCEECGGDGQNPDEPCPNDNCDEGQEPCTNGECEDGKVPVSEEWVEEIRSAVEEAVSEFPEINF